MKRSQLTTAFVRSVREPGRYSDGGGLLLQVSRTGGKAWTQRIVIQGKRRDLGLGPVGKVGLAEARRIAARNRDIAREGGDPRAVPVEPGVPSFATCFEAVLDLKRPSWKPGGKSEAQWLATFRDYMMPLATMPVDAIKTEHVLDVLAPIWHAKHETARRVRQRISEVFEWAVIHDHRADNPAQRVARLLGTNGHHRRHFRALPHEAVSGALAAVDGSKAWIGTKLALRFLVLSWARSGEVRGMRWNEIDLDEALWTVPARRMKAGRGHRVALSPAALAVLREALVVSDDDDDEESLVFPAPRGGMLSDMTMTKLLGELGFDATIHGMRSSARQWAAEAGWPREVAEAALAHVNTDRVEAAYQRSDLLCRRRAMMDAWAAYLDGDDGA